MAYIVENRKDLIGVKDTHISMDYLMCTVLRELGYDEGVDIFMNTEKWYA